MADPATAKAQRYRCGQHGMPYSMWHGMYGCHPDALQHEPPSLHTPKHPSTPDPRALLEAYAEAIPPITALEPREAAAQKAFAALRAVLDLCDESDEPCGIGSGEVLADDIRSAITTTLEAT